MNDGVAVVVQRRAGGPFKAAATTGLPDGQRLVCACVTVDGSAAATDVVCDDDSARRYVVLLFVTLS